MDTLSSPTECARKGWPAAREDEQGLLPRQDYTTSLWSPTPALKNQGSSTDILTALKLSPGL